METGTFHTGKDRTSKRTKLSQALRRIKAAKLAKTPLVTQGGKS